MIASLLIVIVLIENTKKIYIKGSIQLEEGPFVRYTYLRVSAFIPMDARPSNITIKECGTVLERGNVAARGESRTREG